VGGGAALAALLRFDAWLAVVVIVPECWALLCAPDRIGQALPVLSIAPNPVLGSDNLMQRQRRAR
jgi:hypothetical protein